METDHSMALGQLALLMLSDSGFPAGAFAHSCGLEAHARAGLLRDEAALQTFLQRMLGQCAAGPAVFCRRAWAAADAELDPARLPEAGPDALLEQVDRACSAQLAAAGAVSHEASRTLGRSLLATAAAAAPRSTAIARWRRTSAACNHAVVWGAVHRALGVDAHSATLSLVAGTLRGALSAAVRLGAVGPLRAAALQHALAPDVASACAQSGAAGAEPCSRDPFLDMRANQHDALPARLFLS